MMILVWKESASGGNEARSCCSVTVLSMSLAVIHPQMITSSDISYE